MTGVGAAPEPLVRPLQADDDVAAVTALVHAAYAPHAAAGLRFWGTHQSVDDTARRLASGNAWLLIAGGRIVGTATLRPPQPDSPVALYRRHDVFTLAQFCIHPDRKGQGLGRRLHDHVLAAARSRGAAGVALDTAQPAGALIRLYLGWGYALVGACDWRPHTNYRSVVMYRDLSP